MTAVTYRVLRSFKDSKLDRIKKLLAPMKRDVVRTGPYFAQGSSSGTAVFNLPAGRYRLRPE